MMSPPTDFQGLESFDDDSLRACGSYEPSISSSAPSSQASVFSENSSVQSSIASSISDDFRHNQEDARDRICAEAQIQQRFSNVSHQASQTHANWGSQAEDSKGAVASYAAITSLTAEQRKHPRRRSISRSQKLPQLIRQEHRKSNFVDNLVDSATQMVEVIWPLSVVPCRSESGSGRGVLPLRTYVEETLRRSRTSYSTLQVALYYLILIKPFVPASDFTMEQKTDCPAERALMCGRRMFLAALILASKYLQDRNYSAKAWSKMSGLRIPEINNNEMTFLSKVDWKLHIPDLIFKKWTEIVLKYTPNAQSPSPGAGFCKQLPTWKNIIPLLTPELDRVPIPVPDATSASGFGLENHSFASPPATPMPHASVSKLSNPASSSQESTPTPMTVLPRYLEPKPDLAPPTPALARLGPLPTPQMTPSSVASSTPAASACGSRRPSMCSAMSTAQKAGLSRCTLDPFAHLSSQDRYHHNSRRPSAMSIASSGSSPDSMISDRSRSSRASSISSVSTVSSNPSVAPSRACLARQATCRNAKLPLPTIHSREKEEGTATKPILIVDDDTQMVSSPEPADFTPNEKALSAPHRHTKFAAQHTSAPVMDKGRKRCRSRANKRSELHEEVRLLLEEELTMDNVEDDDILSSPSPAADHATRILSRSSSEFHLPTREIQPPASLSRRSSGRMPVQKNEGKKRTCCSMNVPSISPARVAYAEVA